MATSSRAARGGAYRACVFLLATTAVDGPPPLAAETGDVQARAKDGEYGAHALEQHDTISWGTGEYRTTSPPKPVDGGPLGFPGPSLGGLLPSAAAVPVTCAPRVWYCAPVGARRSPTPGLNVPDMDPDMVSRLAGREEGQFSHQPIKRAADGREPRAAASSTTATRALTTAG
eukprot:COSAG06_NODE_2220_length_7321_cov_2.024647_4_plen_173_part_00